MKNTFQYVCYRISVLLLLTIAAGNALAQDTLTTTTDTLPDAAYEVRMPKNTITMYNIHLPVIILIAVIGIIGYISYRYWKQNQASNN